jgi:hypothetical protein
MKGSSAKFAAVAKTSVEDQLQKDMVGLVRSPSRRAPIAELDWPQSNTLGSAV